MTITVEQDTAKSIASILAADIGSTWTHVCLLDRVEGVYRLIARAEEPTLHDGAPDALKAVIAAVRRIERIAQRTLLDSVNELITPEQDTGAGVDAMVACSNAAPPLRCTVIGLTADLSLPSAAYVCTGTMARVTSTIVLEQRHSIAALASLLPLEAEPPDVIVLTGGFDNGPIAPMQAAAEMLAAVLSDVPVERRPAIIYAGNQEARRPVARALGAGFALAVVDNVRPNETIESPLELQRELARVYVERQLANLAGMDTLRRWCATPVINSAEALGIALQYLTRRNDLPSGVLGFDVGGNTTAIMGASQSALHTTINVELGTAAGLRSLSSVQELWRVSQWLPYNLSDNDLAAQLENAGLRPDGVPQALDDLLLLHGAARAALSQVYERWRAERPLTPGQMFNYSLIAGRGGSLAHCPQDGLVALVMLDALQPVGLARLVLDWGSLWPQLGALAAIAPLAASQVFNRDSLRDLGTALCPLGDLRPGDRALRLLVESPSRGPQTLDVAFGDVVSLPLDPEETVTIKAWPHPRLDLGLGEPGLPAQARVQGGTLGLIIDARGRPLKLAINDDDRALWQQQWIENLCSP